MVKPPFPNPSWEFKKLGLEMDPNPKYRAKPFTKKVLGNLGMENKLINLKTKIGQGNL